jgi:hypothetical protein
MATDQKRCPVCSNTELRGHKTPVGYADGREVNLYDFYCPRCGTLEERRDDAPDFSAWMRRWTAPDE